jgi:hypothetical protein
MVRLGIRPHPCLDYWIGRRRLRVKAQRY